MHSVTLTIIIPEEELGCSATILHDFLPVEILLHKLPQKRRSCIEVNKRSARVAFLWMTKRHSANDSRQDLITPQRPMQLSEGAYATKFIRDVLRERYPAKIVN
jgi:hypothetical protein